MVLILALKLKPSAEIPLVLPLIPITALDQSMAFQ
jgi:hypothetical protein